MGKYRKAAETITLISVIAIATAFFVIEMNGIAERTIQRKQVWASMKNDCGKNGGILLTDALGERHCVRLEKIEMHDKYNIETLP